MTQATTDAPAPPPPKITVAEDGRPHYSAEYIEWAFDELRRPFTAEQIGKKPGWNTGARAKENPWVDHCPECGRGHRRADFHLDFVGHAYVVDRLNKVDPWHKFAPLAETDDHLPLFTRDGGLWATLTVCGITKGPEFGEGRSIKACLSDALKRCALRFGVAWQIWAKADTTETDDSTDGTAASPPPAGDQQRAQKQEKWSPFPSLKACIDAGYTNGEEWTNLRERYGAEGGKLTDAGRARVKAYAKDKGMVWPFTKPALVRLFDALGAAKARIDGTKTTEGVDTSDSLTDEEIDAWVAHQEEPF